MEKNLDGLLDLYIDVGRGQACYGMTLVELSMFFEEECNELSDEEKAKFEQMKTDYHNQVEIKI